MEFLKCVKQINLWTGWNPGMNIGEIQNILRMGQLITVGFMGFRGLQAMDRPLLERISNSKGNHIIAQKPRVVKYPV